MSRGPAGKHFGHRRGQQHPPRPGRQIAAAEEPEHAMARESGCNIGVCPGPGRPPDEALRTSRQELTTSAEPDQQLQPASQATRLPPYRLIPSGSRTTTEDTSK